MKAFIEILREKYGLAQPEAEKLLEQMELLTYRKGEHIVREGERNSSFYLVADGIWRGHYLRDGVTFRSGLPFKVTVSFPPGDMWPDFLLWFPSKP